MIPGTMEQDFRNMVREHLSKLESSLVEILRAIIHHQYPQEVFALAFEVFSDSFTSQFPARAYFMDESNSEYFEYLDGKATYPSPVDPDLLQIECVYSRDLEEEFNNRAPDLNTWDIATAEFVLWFSNCWNKAGGKDFTLHATIAHHDSTEEFNLHSKQWQPAYSAFDT